MVSLDDEFGFVTASARRAVRRQRAACGVDPESAERHRGDALARHLDLQYAAIERQIEKRAKRYTKALDDTVREDAIVEMRKILHDAKKAQLNLEWIAASRNPPLDLGTRYFVEDLARQLVADDVELTFVSATQSSYETNSDPWKKIIDKWGDGIPPEEPTVVVIFLPRREESAGLLHPLIVHELGHAAVNTHKLLKDVWEAAAKRKRFAKRFPEGVATLLDEDEEGKLDQETAAMALSKLLGTRITEVLCDSIALHLLGPTYLYSFLVEVAAGNMDFPSHLHPLPRQRIRRALDDLDRCGWAEVMEAADPKLDQWVRLQAAHEPELAGREEFLLWAIEELSAEIRKVAQRHIGKARLFKPDADEFDEVCELLAAQIPPAQLLSGKPVPREQIILASWCAALGKGSGGPAALPEAAERIELAELLPAALELSAVAGAWEAP
jgi:hypothetical protein